MKAIHRQDEGYLPSAAIAVVSMTLKPVVRGVGVLSMVLILVEDVETVSKAGGEGGFARPWYSSQSNQVALRLV